MQVATSGWKQFAFPGLQNEDAPHCIVTTGHERFAGRPDDLKLLYSTHGVPITDLWQTKPGQGWQRHHTDPIY
jgi:hypothetical protein